MRAARVFAHLLALVLTLAPAGCKRHYGVGDQVLVEWENGVYPAVIIEAPGPTKFVPSRRASPNFAATSKLVPPPVGG